MNRLSRRLLRLCLGLLMALSVAGCAEYGVTRAMSGPPRGQTDIFPGNHWNYSFGMFQKAENFENVLRAQDNTSRRGEPRHWTDIKPTRSAIPNLNILQSYFPFDVRWKLKDGREFILENIDVRGVANDYLRKNPIQMGWQRENRPRALVGDGGATLCYEVKDDTVLLKWAISINRTPVNQRLTATGAATHWDIQHEEYLMAAIKGTPTKDINLDNKYE